MIFRLLEYQVKDGWWSCIVIIKPTLCYLSNASVVQNTVSKE